LKRQLKNLDFYPEDEPSRFRQWINRIIQFQQHYRLTDADAVAELQWYGGDILEERLRLIIATHPNATLAAICKDLIQSTLPAGSAQMARRAFNGCRQMDRESGSSFIRRFQSAMAEYRRFASPSEQDLYEDFLSQLNQKYFGELRTGTAESGYLQRIPQPAARLLPAFAAVRQIEASKGKNDRTFDELLKDPANKLHINHINSNSASGTLEIVCRTCQRAAKPSNHDYKQCDLATQNAYCRKCRQGAISPQRHVRTRNRQKLRVHLAAFLTPLPKVRDSGCWYRMMPAPESCGILDPNP
jgi:hypothetical protein